MAIGLLIATGWTSVRAQEQTVGLFLNDERAYEGYTLIAPIFHTNTYLVNNEGQLVHSWEHQVGPGSAVYLLPNGNLLRGARVTNPAINFGGLGGRMQEVTWEGAVVWEFLYSDSLHALHHDVARLPNGNVLMISYEYHSADNAAEAGRDPASLPTGAFWPEQIIEVRPTPPEGGEIVWTWRVWDHLIQDLDASKDNFGVVEDHPELVDINYASARNSDWLHMNAINYNAELDQIIMSIPGFHELWVIDHSTTSEEAAGHTGGRSGKGGDLLYRWGNPEAYRKGTSEDRRLQFQHDVQWIEPGLPGAGNMMIFDNGINRMYSTVREIAPPIDENGAYLFASDSSFSAPEEIWNYDKPGEFFSGFASGQQRLPNGNTLIAEAQTGRIFEIIENGEIVWEYVNPVTNEGPVAQGDSIPPISAERPWLTNSVFRAYRYGVDYPGLQGKDLTPKGTIELAPTATDSEGDIPTGFVLSQNFPNPFNPTTAISFSVPRPSDVTLTVYNVLGQHVTTLTDGRYGQGTYVVHFDATGLPSGVYFYRLESERVISTKMMLLLQ